MKFDVFNHHAFVQLNPVCPYHVVGFNITAGHAACQ